MKHESTKFEEFIESIIDDGNWEYGNGESLTEDARDHLDSCRRLRVEVEAWRSGKLFRWDLGVVGINGVRGSFDTIDEAVDALMEEE
jgi:hypothetical protein